MMERFAANLYIFKWSKHNNWNELTKEKSV